MNGMVPTYANTKRVKLSCHTRLLLTGQAKHLAQVSVSSAHWTLVCSTSTCSLLGTTSDFSALDYQTQLPHVGHTTSRAAGQDPPTRACDTTVDKHCLSASGVQSLAVTR